VLDALNELCQAGVARGGVWLGGRTVRWAEAGSGQPAVMLEAGRNDTAITWAPVTSARMRVMSIEEFRDRDSDYLGWVAAHPDGYVINIGRSRRGYARVHRATCGTITSRPPLTDPYIKVCSGTLMELDRWALSRTGAVAERCGTCQPLRDAPCGQQPGPTQPAASAQADGAASSGTPAGQEWEIDGPGDDRQQVWLWDTRYIPYERLTPGQHAARDAPAPISTG